MRYDGGVVCGYVHVSYDEGVSRCVSCLYFNLYEEEEQRPVSMCKVGLLLCLAKVFDVF